VSEECSDFIDYRIFLHRLILNGVINVYVSRHAIERFKERLVREYRKLDVSVILDVFRNIVRDGYCKALFENLVFWTKRYVLICKFFDENSVLVVTVISKRVLSDKFKRLLKRGVRVKWRSINVNLKS